MKGVKGIMKTSSALRTVPAVLLALALLVAGPAPALAQTYFWWQIVDETGQPYTGENVQCSVYRPNIHGAAILHTSSTLSNNTAANDPLWADSTGKFHFYSSLNTPVDVTCFYDYGGGGFSGRIDRFTHRIMLARQGVQVSRFSVNSTAATYQTATNIYLPAGAVVRDVIIQNLNPLGLGTYHLSVGFLGNHTVATANALVNTQALSSPDEWVRPHTVITSLAGSAATYNSNHRGLAMINHIAAANRAPQAQPYLVHVATGLQVGYSAQPGTGAGVRAHVFVIWQKFHSSINRLPFGAGR